MPEHYQTVPKPIADNLDFRREVVTWGSENDKHAAALWHMCQNDLLFWINVFGWTYDSRKIEHNQSPVLPFITYDYQDDILLEMNDCVGKRDICFKKSRDMGLSWLMLTLFTWRWCFRPMESYLLVSRNEDYVDKVGNAKSLFWKIDFLLDKRRMPAWMLPHYTRTKLRLSNDTNGSMIDGESTTGDVARGDRRTAIALDELAAFETDSGYKALSATLSATRCRIFNSTPIGMGNAFADVAHSPNIKSVRVHWSQHPEKCPGLYQYIDNELQLIDAPYWDDHGTDYPFVLDGKLRSPWYDAECRRAINPQEIASELDIDFHGSEVQFFPNDILARHASLHATEPFLKGELEYDGLSLDPLGFTPHRDGRLLLWMHLDAAGKPPTEREYFMGVDVATGTGSSNSVISIGDRKTKEKVIEFATPGMRPEELAGLAVALARWLTDDHGHTAFMIWESNGPGRSFGSAVIDAGYRRIYYRRNEHRIGKKPSDFPGWVTTKDTKRTLLSTYRKALATDAFINRSREAIDECRHYVFLPNQNVSHSSSTASVDPSGARENHGDRVMADALCSHVIAERQVHKPTSTPTIQPGSLAYRRLQATREAAAREWW